MAYIESGDFFANVAESGRLPHEGEGRRTPTWGDTNVLAIEVGWLAHGE